MCGNIPSMPQTATDVAKYFQKVFRDSIDFTDRAMRSLNDCITKPEILWECFFAIANHLGKLYGENTPAIESAFKKACGWDMARGEGSQTRKDKKLKALRNDIYEGRPIYAEPHVRRGNDDNSNNCVRVYFCYDSITSRIIISYVGGHLDNFTTKNL